MITAAAALRLPRAQLSAEEKRAANVLEQAIDNHVHQHMSWAGIEEPFVTTEKRASIIIEVTHRLKRAGWLPEWEMTAERGRFSDNLVHTGWKLKGLGPDEEAYRLAGAILASG